MHDRSAALRVGIDLGGTKIEAIALAPRRQRARRAGACHARRRLSPPRSPRSPGSYAAIERPSSAAAAAVGVGIPGTISPATGLVKNANSTWLIGHAARPRPGAHARPPGALRQRRRLLRAVRGDRRRRGRRRQRVRRDFGTGVGGGIVVRRPARPGPQRDRRRVGPQPAALAAAGRCDERPGPACYCGRAGCIETFLSGPGLARDHARGDRAAPGAAEAIVAAAEAGDRHARAALDRYADRLARALATVINIFDPEVDRARRRAVEGGRLYDERAPALGPAASSPTASTRAACRRRHGDSSGVRGAAWLWPAER